MVKLANASKGLLLGAAFTLSSLAPAALVSADATTMVPNTTSCYSQPTSVTKGSDTFTAKWNNDNTFTITVNKKLTKDITLYASSYHLTSNLYKGGCFSHDATTGTSPQTYDNNTQTIVLAKDFVGTKTVTVVLPTTCYNEQVDLYSGKPVYDQGGYLKGYSPLNDTVTAAGHDDYNWIAGNIMLTSLNPACQPGKGAETPTETVTPAAPVAPAPQLVDTGLNIVFTSAAALLTAAAAVFVGTRRTDKVSK